MVSHERKPWEEPIQYNDWFPEEDVETTPPPTAKQEEAKESVEARPVLMSRPLPLDIEDDDDDDTGLMDEDERGPDTASEDEEPLDYSRGVHDEEFGVDEDYDPED